MKIHFLPVIIILLTSVLSFYGCSISTNGVATVPKATEEMAPPTVDSWEPFYGVGAELEEKLTRIAMADAEIQALLEGKDQSFTVDGHTVIDVDFNLSVGVRLRDDVTDEDFQEWMKSSREDCNLIDEYAGVLNIGYNDTYHLTFDMENETVIELVKEEKIGPGIPVVTAEEKQRAVEIALVDPTLAQILEGKEYQIAPEGRIGVWHVGSTRLGVAFEISFDRIYTIDAFFPQYQRTMRHFTGDVEGLIISVLLEDNRVASILPKGPIN